MKRFLRIFVQQVQALIVIFQAYMTECLEALTIDLEIVQELMMELFQLSIIQFFEPPIVNLI